MACNRCKTIEAFTSQMTMAFQPIVDLATRTIWGYEALVRGINGESAGSILSQVTPENRYAFDQACRVKAIELAGAKLSRQSTARVSINFNPNAVYEPRACIAATLATAAKVGLSLERLMFEFTENERMADVDHLKNIIHEYRKMGFVTALDDFGAGYAGLGLLASFQPDLIKIDMELIRDIPSSPRRRAIVTAIVSLAENIGVKVLAEGVETNDELLVLQSLGINLFQGYLFAKPQIEYFTPANSIPLLSKSKSNFDRAVQS